MHILLALCAFLFLTCAANAQDDPTEITVDGSNFLKFDEGKEVDFSRPGVDFPDNLLKRRFIENRLRLDVYRGNLRAGVRLLYFRPSENDGVQYGLKDETRVDKRFIEAALHPFTLRAGHFSDLWANGLTFSSFENRDLYFDSELDGFRSQLEMGPLTLIGLRGSSQDGLLAKEADATAGRAMWRGGILGMGFSYVHVDSGYYAETNASGFDVKFNRGAVGLNFERSWSETNLAAESSEGHAMYVGLVLSKWQWSMLLDYKDYDYGYVTPFQNPPTVYRELGPRLLQGREPHVMNIPNEVGYQVELSGQATSSTFTTLHYHLSSAHAEDQSGIPLPTLQQEDSPFWEAFASAEQTFSGGRTGFLEIGLNEEAAASWLKRKWFQIRYSTPFNSAQVEAEVEEMLVTDVTRDDEKFFDQLYALGVSFGSKLSLFGSYQLSDDEELKNREGDNWPSIEAATSLGENDRHRLILFYGRERGGLKCSNGVCRQVQAFSGFRLTLETTL